MIDLMSFHPGRSPLKGRAAVSPDSAMAPKTSIILCLLQYTSYHSDISLSENVGTISPSVIIELMSMSMSMPMIKPLLISYFLSRCQHRHLEPSYHSKCHHHRRFVLQYRVPFLLVVYSSLLEPLFWE